MPTSMTSLNNQTQPIIGVLALQGCVTPHRYHLESLGAQYKEVKTVSDLKEVDGLILPGGESSTMLKLIDVFQLEDALIETFQRVPIWGICAGSILMAQNVIAPAQRSFGLLNISIERNAYGSQLNSFNTFIQNTPVSFIRAPQIITISADITVKAEHEDKPVWLQKNFYMATTFHPELNSTSPSIMHKEFFEMVLLNKNVN